jgi:hypothetical protein
MNQTDHSKCNGCDAPLDLKKNLRIADGCPCNSPRGINHGRVPTLTCCCLTCDPAETGSTRYPLEIEST